MFRQYILRDVDAKWDNGQEKHADKGIIMQVDEDYVLSFKSNNEWYSFFYDDWDIVGESVITPTLDSGEVQIFWNSRTESEDTTLTEFIYCSSSCYVPCMVANIYRGMLDTLPVLTAEAGL